MAIFNLQKVLFKIKELTSGNRVTLNLKQIESHFNGNRNDIDLSNLLKHAVQTAEFYKNFDSNSINDFPVINKTQIKEHFPAFRSREFLNKPLVEMTTSGSTGTPFTVFQDIAKKQRNLADTFYFANLAGYELGQRLFYFKIWAKAKMAPDYQYRLQNIVPFDVIKLDDKTIKRFIDEVENKQGANSVLGYVSALESIIRYCDKIQKKSFKSEFKSIITMSEGLSVETKVKLNSLFNCPVVSRYSNLENGIIAQQLINEERFLINTASYFVEIMDFESDKVVSHGEKGRIVVTDLFNYGMPLIRYDTGDIGSIIKDQDGKLFLSSVEGRKLDLIFDTNNQLVSSYIVYKNMWQYKEISQYQLIQVGQKEYVFKINCDSEFSREDKLIAEFKSYLGNDADFKVEYVDEIPLLDSGKRRKIVNLYKNTI
jgi:phenylacetate-CoA ligase